jgi:hypothetical protein
MDEIEEVKSAFEALMKHLHTLVRYFASGFISLGAALLLQGSGVLLDRTREILQSSLVMAVIPLVVGILLYAIVIGVFHPIMIKPIRFLAFMGLGIPMNQTRAYSEYMLLKTRSRRRRGLPDLRAEASDKDESQWLRQFQKNIDFRWACMYLILCSGLGILLSTTAMVLTGQVGADRMRLYWLFVVISVAIGLGGIVAAWHVMRLEIYHLREAYRERNERQAASDADGSNDVNDTDIREVKRLPPARAVIPAEAPEPEVDGETPIDDDTLAPQDADSIEEGASGPFKTS